MTLGFANFDARSSLDRQRTLFRRCFPETVGTPVESEAHYDWKFRRFPAEIPSYEYVATTPGGDLAGYYAAIPYPYLLDGRSVTAGMVCDVMTDPEQRGQGVFTRLGRYSVDQLAASGIHFVTGYPIRPEVLPGHLKVGWRVAFQLPMYIRVLRVEALLKSRRLGALAPLGNACASLYAFVVKSSRKRDRHYAAETLSVDALLSMNEYDAFFDAWSVQAPISLKKSRGFLQWRLGAPGAKYAVVALKKETRLVGVAILRRTVLQGVPSVALLDLMLLDEHRSGVSSMMSAVEQYARDEEAEAIVAMMSRHQAAHLSLLRHGFLRTPAVFSLIVKRLSSAIDEDALMNERNWRLMWIDSDDL